MPADADIRDQPTPEFIAALREQYRLEPEIDRLLTRKTERRAGPPFRMVSLEQLTRGLQSLLRSKLAAPFEISAPRWLAGGASKLQMRFELHWTPPGAALTISDLVVRMEPAESLNPSSRLREFQVLDALQGHVPVPRVYWVDADGEHFPEPALVYAFAAGVAKPTQVGGAGVTGLGSRFGPRLRRLLSPQFVKHLARVHTFDLSMTDLSSFVVPPAGTTDAAQLQVQWTRRVWAEDRGAELPLMEVAANWLERNQPVLDVASIVHGDYRAGNFLFDEGSGEFTAILDWERACIGDRHRDIAWSTTTVIGHLDDDGKTFLMCGLMPLEEFYDRYQEASGLNIDRKRLHYYEVLNRYQQLQTVLGTAYRVVRLSKSHQNVVIARLQKAAYLLAEDLRQALEGVV
jgi:aminoglycoside phosphotransferase (APT) family kinase protein